MSAEKKCDILSDALDLVIEHATSARELCEVGHHPEAKIRLYLLQAQAALQFAVDMVGEEFKA